MYFILFIPIGVTLVGAYLIFKLRGRVFNPFRFFSDLGRLLAKKGAFKNLSLALAGTLGVGNIVGVAVGLSVGGAGSVFWLVLSAVPAVAIKYSESALALDCGGVGMISASRRAFSRYGTVLSYVYALFGAALALFMGAGLQSASYSKAMGVAFNERPIAFSPLLALCAVLAVAFGIDKIKNFTAVSVSLASVSYIVIALGVIVANRSNIPQALEGILGSAFTPSGALGGFLGVMCSSCVREGFLRGILSNESGLGTSALAHAHDSMYTPHEAGVIGALEVFMDTVVLCPLTALMILVSEDGAPRGAVESVFASLRGFDGAFSYLLAASIGCFALSAVISWSAYGVTFVSVFSTRVRIPFIFVYILFVLLGGALDAEFFVSAVDALMLPLSAITLLTLIKSSDRIVFLSEKNLDL